MVRCSAYADVDESAAVKGGGVGVGKLGCLSIFQRLQKSSVMAEAGKDER